MVADYFRALPAYLGGKRRLTPLIFAALNEVVPREEWSGAIFLDPFLGGGSVSLHAKAVGFEVHCNDVAFRSALIGHALIENSVVHLTSADLENLLERPPGAYPRR